MCKPKFFYIEFIVQKSTVHSEIPFRSIFDKDMYINLMLSAASRYWLDNNREG